MGAQLIKPVHIRSWLPPRKKDAHKGECGRVLVIAGSRGMGGAAVLCSWGAARSGAGLVRVAVVKSQQNNVVKRAPLEVTTVGLSEDKHGRLSFGALSQIRRAINDFRPTVLAVGPGLGGTTAVRKIIWELVFQQKVPVVLDADGLNALSKIKVWKKLLAPLILTPHAGEISRILRQPVKYVGSNRQRAAVLAARRFDGSVCLLKGPATIVTGGRQVWENTTGNPAMASGGMGDVLTGVIASLWAQMPLQNTDTGLKAACAGAFLHGLAGDIAVRSFPERTLLATDVAQALPKAFQKIFHRRNSL